MSFELWQLFMAGVGYLLLLFLVAYATDRGWLPARLVRHPLVYTLSLGVYATSWTYYGSVGFAASQGYQFLTIYLGVTLAFLLSPLLLRPILRITREYQLASLADLFAFRYQSQLAGMGVTLFMLAGSLPYIALQIRAVTESLQVLTQEVPPDLIALGFCLTLTLFAVLFGARHSSARERHEGLVVAIAFESLVKLVALLAAGLFALFGVFGGPSGLDSWLAAHPQRLAALNAPVREGPWATLLLLAFAAAFLLPRQFHMAFTENMEERNLGVASWAFPLFLLLLNLSIPPILWAGQVLSPDSQADYYALGITLHSGSWWLPVLTFLGGVSAASAMMIVATLALAAMCMNHFVLPASFPPRLNAETDIYRWLLWGRRMLITVIIGAGYGFFLLLERNQGLVQLGLISFVAVTQFLPGVVGLLYWRRATRTGFLLGLAGGAGAWGYTLLLPLLQRTEPLAGDLTSPLGTDPWGEATFWTLTINSLLFVVGSLFTRPSSAEQEAAAACCKDSFTPPSGALLATSPAQIEAQLARITGPEMASHEVAKALADLGLPADEQRPTELRRLRERVERNLSGLLGPLLARVIIDERVQLDPKARTALAASVRVIEQQLELSRTRLKGLAAELDGLRRYHRQVLQDLPIGVCSLGPDLEVISWNQAMQEITGLVDEQAVGRPLKGVQEPWSGLLTGFLLTEEQHLRKLKMRVGGRERLFNLHKAAIEDPVRGVTEERPPTAGMVVLVEDLTDLHLLESELAHSERLASVGRLAAGVAHEIGNPVTGIACLAQNLLADREDPEFVGESLEQILEQTRRISAIVRSLVSFSHSGAVADHAPTAVELGRCVDEAVRLVRLSHAGKQVVIGNDCPADLATEGEHQQLVQVFVNLLTNACDASRPGGRVRIEGRRDGASAVVEVIDEGVGIPEDLLDQVFDPFFTTKQPGEGTGLGLPMVYNLVKEHSGTVSLRSRPGEGTRVTLRFPALREEERH